ncbi:hypothetical protein [Helicobacter labetoulli]|uniref:hypothetical protein n=1 Tax=Helicobacter labetoulli TaxID=2315333 RepID=UPI0039EBC5CE
MPNLKDTCHLVFTIESSLVPAHLDNSLARFYFFYITYFRFIRLCFLILYFPYFFQK